MCPAAFALLLLVRAALGQELAMKMSGGASQARRLARAAGYRFEGLVKGFEDVYVLHPPKIDQNAYYQKRGAIVTTRLENDHRVAWVEEQTPKSRQKRDLLYDPPETDRSFNDELWDQEWYLHPNVLPVYRSGVTGKHVRILILDDGLEHTHDDLRRNYDPAISYDCNEDDPDPLPRYAPDGRNGHGTRCAGVAAMTADNGKCGVGVAYDARVGAVKLLDGLVNDRLEGTALSHARHLVDVYSASWGPTDDGRTVDGPGRLASEALQTGAEKGRGGRGSIYVWASGNGGANGDDCACDGYLNSVYTMSIGSASQQGKFPWYGEACASTLAVTYSSGARRERMVSTTDLRNRCTTRHTGTSASAPLASGIVALALEVNPELTWRDVQHLAVWTSDVAPLVDNPGWIQNAAGLWTNIRFGFGLMDAFAFVAAAANWTTVPAKSTCRVALAPSFRASFVYGVPAVIPIVTSACRGTPQRVNYLEHVEIETDLEHPVRGAVQIRLTSARGTEVQILGARKLDDSKEGFKRWRFMSVMTWGETPAGVWTLHVADSMGPVGNSGHVSNVTLILHGTRRRTAHARKGHRKYFATAANRFDYAYD